MFLGIIIQVFLGIYLVESWIFSDSSAELFEHIMYQLVALPPFFIAILFYKETKKTTKSLLYSGFFYLISIVIIFLFESVPTRITYYSGQVADLGSSGFYVTGGGVGGSVIIVHFIVTCIFVYALNTMHKNLK